MNLLASFGINKYQHVRVVNPWDPREKFLNSRDPLVDSADGQLAFVLERIFNQFGVCEWRLFGADGGKEMKCKSLYWRTFGLRV